MSLWLKKNVSPRPKNWRRDSRAWKHWLRKMIKNCKLSLFLWGRASLYLNIKIISFEPKPAQSHQTSANISSRAVYLKPSFEWQSVCKLKFWEFIPEKKGNFEERFQLLFYLVFRWLNETWEENEQCKMQSGWFCLKLVSKMWKCVLC